MSETTAIDTSGKPPRDLLEIVLETRHRELERRTGNPDVDIFESTALDGWCHENALALAERLYYDEIDYDPYLVWGGVADDAYNSFETVARLEHSGRVHFWVEAHAPGAEQTVVLDLSCEGTTHNCEPFCGYSTPPEYRYVEKDPCYIEYVPMIEPVDLLDLPEYERLRESRPELFAQDPTIAE